MTAGSIILQVEEDAMNQMDAGLRMTLGEVIVQT
jgi:hypothetical protein